MKEEFARTELLIGEEALNQLQNARVAVFGVGGVGGFVVEALVRSGIGSIDLVDNDVVALSNLNRQIIATKETIGRYKVDVMEERIHSIAPEVKVTKHALFYLKETTDQFDFRCYDYVVDAIDTVSGKLALAEQAHLCSTPIISSMGAGNKMDPAQFQVADIYETSIDPLARVMRRELKRRGIDHLKVVFSKEVPSTPLGECNEVSSKRSIPGSIAFVPSVAGLIIAGEVIKDLIGWQK